MANKVTRREILGAGLKAGVALSLLGMAGCASKESGSNSTPAPAPAPAAKPAPKAVRGGKVRLYDARQTAANKEAVTKQLGEFTKKTEIQVELAEVQGQMNATEKIRVMIASGDPPDVWHQDMGVPSYLAAGIPEALDPYLQRENIKLDHIAPYALEVHRYQGKLYTVPIQSFARVLVANVDLFEKAGVPLPDKWNDPTWTVDEFVNRAKKLTKFEGNKMVQAGSVGFTHFSYVWLWDANYVSDDGKKMTTTHPDFIAALQFGQDLHYRHKVQPTATDSAELRKLAGQSNLFLGGRAAIWNCSTGNLASLMKSDIKWRLIPLPKAKITGAYYSPGGFAMLQGAKDKERAWELIKWAADQSTAYALAASYGRPPASIPALALWVKQMEEQRPGAGFQIFADAIAKYPFPARLQGYQSHLKYAELQKIIAKGMTDLLATKDRKSPEAVAKWMEEQGNIELNKA